MRNISVPLFVLLLVWPGIAKAQSFELMASAGPTITDSGNSFAAGIGFSPTPRLTIAVNFERTHLSSQTSVDRGVISSFRGGTLFLGTAELRFAPFGRGRFGPYGLAGLAGGVSRPNVNATFPNRVTNQVRALFVGGGVEVPLGTRMTVFVDARMMGGAEGLEGIVGVGSARAGVAWRF